MVLRPIIERNLSTEISRYRSGVLMTAKAERSKIKWLGYKFCICSVRQRFLRFTCTGAGIG